MGTLLLLSRWTAVQAQNAETKAKKSKDAGVVPDLIDVSPAQKVEVSLISLKLPQVSRFAENTKGQTADLRGEIFIILLFLHSLPLLFKYVNKYLLSP